MKYNYTDIPRDGLVGEWLLVDLRALTNIEAKDFIETHTNLEKRAEGVYLLSEATTGIDGEEIPERILTIE